MNIIIEKSEYNNINGKKNYSKKKYMGDDKSGKLYEIMNNVHKIKNINYKDLDLNNKIPLSLEFPYFSEDKSHIIGEKKNKINFQNHLFDESNIMKIDPFLLLNNRKNILDKDLLENKSLNNRNHSSDISMFLIIIFLLMIIIFLLSYIVIYKQKIKI